MTAKTLNWICTTIIAMNSTALQAADWGNLPEQPSSNKHAKVLHTYVLNDTPITSLNSNLSLDITEEQAIKNGLTSFRNPGIGSGLVPIPNQAGEFYMLTDRGPNFDNLNSAGKVKGKVFPVPNFTPAIVHVKLTNESIEVLRSIPLVDTQGLPVTGLPNDKNDEQAYKNTDSGSLPYRASGLDTEALQLLPNGKFLISDEYGSSIIVADTNGKVLMRYVPEGKKYAEAGYPIKAILPAIFKQRRSNRGFESLALTPDAKTVYAILQSPMGDTKDKLYENSRLVRIARLDITNPLEAKVTGVFTVLQSAKSDYPETDKQKDLKYSDAVAISNEKLLLLERATKKVKLILADLSHATNLLAGDYADSLKPEENSHQLSDLNITPASTETVFDSRDVFFEIDTDKLEGLAVLNTSVVAMSNDNDFSVGDNTNNYPSKVWIIQLGKKISD
ncbi:MAG: esterase-like activity of phytase family protein [Methylotenera sp.]|nr:esterase-like activity of phytase family protein [Methylotenera sp.]